MPKVERYKWPALKSERLALIVANLTQPLPRWRGRGRVRPAKDDVEDTSEESDDETP